MGQSTGRRRRAAQWRGPLASLLTAACLVYLVANTNLAELERAIQRAHYGWLGLALACSVASVIVKGVRWWALYPVWARPSLGLAIAGLATGQVANWAAPWRVGEVMRVGLVAAPGSAAGGGRGVALSVGVLVIEKLLDSATLVLTVAVLVLLVGVPGWLSATALLGAGLACAIGLALAIHLRHRPAVRGWPAVRAWLARWLPGRLGRLFDDATGLGEGLSAWLAPRLALPALGCSVLAWVLGALTNVLAFASVGLDLPNATAASLAVLAALYGAAVVPTLPGRLGVFQSVCVVTLAPFGVAVEPALVFSFALYLAVYAAPVLIGLAALVFLGPGPLGVRKTAAPTDQT